VQAASDARFIHPATNKHMPSRVFDIDVQGNEGRVLVDEHKSIVVEALRWAQMDCWHR
jgi:hypothetical protein